MAFRNSKIILICLQLLAFQSVWQWYFARLSTSADEFYGIAALAAVAVVALVSRPKLGEISNFGLIVASIIVYPVSFAFDAPPLVRAVIAMTSLAFSISGWRFGRRFQLGIWFLLLLGLPVVASMQFYLGFPLRVIVGEATVFLLKLNGLAIFREGVCLHFGEQLIWIDAPCSGVKMLWTGFFLTALLTAIYNFRLAKSLAAFAAAFVVILLGNVFRATGLFYLEAGIVKMPDFAHSAIGVMAFAATCAAIVAVVLKFKNLSFGERQNFSSEANSSISFSRSQTLIMIVACCLAIAASFSPATRNNPQPEISTADFPREFENQPLKNLELSEREQYFLQDFPGEIRRFTDGEREIIIRRVTEATRKLHPASDCFSAIGYQISPLPLKIDESNQKWSCFNATKNIENLKVCERIYTEKGESWTDVSSWYWSAISERNKNYWAITVAETIE